MTYRKNTIFILTQIQIKSQMRDSKKFLWIFNTCWNCLVKNILYRMSLILKQENNILLFGAPKVRSIVIPIGWLFIGEVISYHIQEWSIRFIQDVLNIKIILVKAFIYKSLIFDKSYNSNYNIHNFQFNFY